MIRCKFIGVFVFVLLIVAACDSAKFLNLSCITKLLELSEASTFFQLHFFCSTIAQVFISFRWIRVSVCSFCCVCARIQITQPSNAFRIARLCIVSGDISVLPEMNIDLNITIAINSCVMKFSPTIIYDNSTRMRNARFSCWIQDFKTYSVFLQCKLDGWCTTRWTEESATIKVTVRTLGH